MTAHTPAEATAHREPNLLNLTVGQIEAMPEPQRSQVRQQILEAVLGRMAVKEEAYLQRDYDKCGSQFNYEAGE